MSIGLRRMRLVAAALLLVQAIALAALVARSPAVLLPVTISSGSRTVTLAGVDVGIGVIVPLLLGAVSLSLGSWRRDLPPLVAPSVGWLETSLSWSIMVFLVAQLNGIRELGTLVAIYALTSAISLFGVLQRRRREPPLMLAASFGAMVGIVPWGLIAWYEIAPVVAFGAGPAGWVRVLTVAMLALFLAAGATFWWASRRSHAGTVGAAASLGADWIAMVVSVVARSTLACSVVVAISIGIGFGLEAS